TAGAEMRAARQHAVRRGFQHFQGAGLVEAAAARGQLGDHRLPGQRAGDEDGLAVLAAGDAAAVVAEVEDLDLERGTVESGHVAGASERQGAGIIPEWDARVSDS